MNSRVSQKDVARAAKVHPTTVSLALRNSSRLPEATREHIQALARELGYQPDPALDALNAYRLASRKPIQQGTLAWIDGREPQHRTDGKGASAYDQQFRAMAAAAASRGYKLDSFPLGEGGYTWPRLSTVLRERGIRGVLVGPLPGGRARLRLRWEWFSCVAIGLSLARPELHRVAHDLFYNMRLLLRGVRHAGCRRPGLIMLHHENLRTDTLRHAAFVSAHPGAPVLWCEQLEAAAIVDWYREQRPDAILVQNAPYVVRRLREAGVSVPGEVVVASCCAHEHPGFAGVTESPAMLATATINELVGMIHASETGLPDTPLRVQVPGKWTDGEGEFALRADASALRAAKSGA
jgi:DNA-binding LacI/PurR family transcriptional regulator